MEEQIQPESIEDFERSVTDSSAGVLRRVALFVLLAAAIVPFAIAIATRFL